MTARKTWRAWTQKEMLRAEELTMRGLTAGAVAQELGRTQPSVQKRLNALGVRRPSQMSRWFQLLRQPHTLAGVAEELGLTIWAVKRAKNRLRRAGFAVVDATRIAS